jgi:hypothetical protein
MYVVAHQAIGVTAPPEALHHPGQGGQEHLAVLIVAKDSLACVTTGSDMIESLREFNAERTSHGAVYKNYVIFQDVTP